MPKANQDIRDILEKERIYQYEIAHKMGILENSFSRKLRFELTDDEKKFDSVLEKEIPKSVAESKRLKEVYSTSHPHGDEV